MTSAPPKSPQAVVVDGKVAIQCDGTDDELTFSGLPVEANEYAVFFVVRKKFTTGQHPLWSNRNGSAPVGGTESFLGFDSRIFLYQNSATPKSLAGATPVGNNMSTLLFELEVGGGSRQLVLDGVIDATDSATPTKTFLASGTLCAEKNAHAAYDLREVIMYDRQLSQTERATVRSELKQAWSIP